MIQEYFRHDYQTRGDEKIIRLIFELGWEGYGLYWGMVELLYIGKGKIRADYKMIAYELRTEQAKIEKIAKEYGLFYEAEGNLRCEAIDNRLESRISVNAARAEATKRHWERRRNGQPMVDHKTTIGQPQDDHKTTIGQPEYSNRIGQDRIEENKIEQNRIEEKIITHSSPPISEADLVKAIAGPGDNIKCPLWDADKKCKAGSGICEIKGARFINGSCFLPNSR